MHREGKPLTVDDGMLMEERRLKCNMESIIKAVVVGILTAVLSVLSHNGEKE